MKKLLLGSTMAAALASAPAANAAVFIGERTVGTNTVNLSITTDDTIGLLSMANVLDWIITISGPGGSDILNSGNSAFTFLSGASFSATATELLFDFDSGGGHMQFDNFNQGGSAAYCLASTNPIQNTCVGNPPREVATGTAGFQDIPGSGIAVLGRISGAVPEPATWAFMIFGFGAIGSAMRRQRKASVKVSYA